MDEGSFRPRAAETEYRDRAPYQSRPDRIAFWALILALVAMVAGAASARAGSGGVGSGGGGGGGSADGSRYTKIWDGYSQKEQRWAHKTSDCESGGDPKAIGGGGEYRGAFQFTKPTWRRAPKSPGGDPIKYRWKTQAVVAVSLKHKEGTGAWPVCG
jgi:hypothetical protein